MFSFNTTATLQHVTPLPPGTTFEAVLALLHNHDFLIRLDPELQSYEKIASPPDAPDTKRYKITDHMKGLPRPFPSTVSFEALMTNTEDGLKWVIQAPMGLVQNTRWTVKRSADVVVAAGEGKGKEEESEWSLVEDVEIKASRLLVGTVKGKCEANWRGVHGRFLARLKGEGGEEGEA